MSDILKADHVSYTYQGKYQKVHALRDVSCTFAPGRFYAVTGRSGSGKTTLLSLLAGLDRPTQGEIFYDGTPYAELDTAKLRREKLSIVFQNFQLFSLLTVEENITYPMELSKVKTAQARERAVQLLEAVGLPKELRKKYPAMLSGGEQQRVAIARALAKNPKLLLCDEPTGALDYETGKAILKLLQDTCRDTGRTVVVVTHNSAFTAIADRVIHVREGSVAAVELNETPLSADVLEW